MIGSKPILSIVVLGIVAAAVSLMVWDRDSAHAGGETGTVGRAPSGPIRDVTKQPFWNPAPRAQNAAFVPPRQAALLRDEIDPRDGLVVTQQVLRRGGLGSKAMLSFTLVNRNDFAVKDVGLRCEFAGPDGRFITARQRVFTDTVDTNARKRYAPTLVGFVSTSLSQGRCEVVTASRA